MRAAERRERILELLHNAEAPISGSALAQMMGVSRQIIVQDITLLRTGLGIDILSTYQGYVIPRQQVVCSRVYKVRHSTDRTEEELREIVDLGGFVKDVFVYHSVYGVVRGDLNIRSGKDIRAFLQRLRASRSAPLMQITDDYHYHTVEADSQQTLDQIQERLETLGFRAPLLEHEPVDFRKR